MSAVEVCFSAGLVSLIGWGGEAGPEPAARPKGPGKNGEERREGVSVRQEQWGGAGGRQINRRRKEQEHRQNDKYSPGGDAKWIIPCISIILETEQTEIGNRKAA